MQINEIISKTPRGVEEFFRRFEGARDRLVLTRVAEALNRAGVEEMWYEIFRDIYILKRQAPRLETDGVRKNPYAFATFARTWEPMIMRPEFWFGESADLRLDFERYLYSRTGGGVWGAMDWELDRYLQTRIYEDLKSNEALVLKRIAALTLAARAIAAGEFGLYIEERDDVTLPLSGVTNAALESPLLTYYHYDRHTKLSYARAFEGAERIRFEPRWLALAVLSDVVLKESDARSTQAAAKRVMLESLAQAMLRIKLKLASSGSHQAIIIAAETIYALITEAPEKFVALSEAEILKLLGVKATMRKDFAESKLANAEAFWKAAWPHFETLRESYEKAAAQFPEPALVADRPSEDEVVRFVREALERGKLEELVGEVGRVSFRAALKELIAKEEIAIEPKTLALSLLGELGDNRFKLLKGRRRTALALPKGLPFTATEKEELRAWTKEVMEALSARSSKLEPLKYRNIDFPEVKDAAEKLWNFYFTEDEICRDRWIISIARVLEILEKDERDKFGTVSIGTTFKWATTNRGELKARLLKEKNELAKKGLWPKDIEAIKKRLLAKEPVSIDKLLKGEARILVMIAVLAKLDAKTRKAHPELWKNRNDIFSFFTHILFAGNHNFDLPFPWHLDVFSGSYLRLGRTHSRQTNILDELIDGQFRDGSEAQLYKAFRAYEV